MPIAVPPNRSPSRSGLGWHPTLWRGPEDSLDRLHGGLKPRHRVVPSRKQSVAGQMRHPEIDFHIQLLELGNVRPPATGGKHAVVEYDVGIDLAREYDADQHQVGAHEADVGVARPQAVGKLLGENHE